MAWFKPTCPVNASQKAWLETGLLWLAERLGVQQLIQSDVKLLTDQDFPEPFDSSEDSARQLLDRVASFMNVKAGQIDLLICPDSELPGRTWVYTQGETDPSRVTLRVIHSQMADESGLITTLATALSHHILVSRNLIGDRNGDHEYIRDLLTVFLGFGVFASNSIGTECCSSGGPTHELFIGRDGRLNSTSLGYVMAVVAWTRDDPAGWRSQLRLDARDAFDKGTRYIQKTGNCLFTTSSPARSTISIPQLIEQLERSDASGQIAAIWELMRRGEPDSETVDSIHKALASRQDEVCTEAARALGSFGPRANAAAGDLIFKLDHKHARLRVNAVTALSQIGAPNNTLIVPIGRKLRDDDRSVVVQATAVLARIGPDASETIPQLLEQLASALVNCDYALIEVTLVALTAINGELHELLENELRSRDEELYHQAVAVYEDWLAEFQTRA